MSATGNRKQQKADSWIYEYPWQAWQLIVHHCGDVELQKLDVLSNDVSCSAALLISSELVVDFHNVSKFVG